MIGYRLPSAALVCVAALATAGCTKTSDGSYEMGGAVPEFFGMQPQQTAGLTAMNDYAAAPAYVPPRDLHRKAAMAEAWTPTPHAPASAAAMPVARSLSCSNGVSAGGRVSVICQ
jgi:hypothetical protein